MAKLRVPVTSLDHILGGDNAPVTVVEYGDYECPHCAASQPIVADILLRLGDRLRFVYRHFRWSGVHPVAGPAAEAAEFAGSREPLQQMHQSSSSTSTPIERAGFHHARCET
jgi:protein-disulfide isomerase